MSAKPDLKVVELFPSNFRDPVATLRYIADQIEAGEYGDVRAIAAVMLSELPDNTAVFDIFAMGKDADAPKQAVMLQHGANRLAQAALGLGLEP